MIAKKKINQIPNILTLLNLLLGCIAIVLTFNRNIEVAVYLVLIAAILDYLDGFVAKMLGAVSDLGKMLDSLADVVSFGVVPAMILFQIMIMALTYQNELFGFEKAGSLETLFLYFPMLIVVFSALRLGRYNISDDEKISFKGLPTPANAVLIATSAYVFLEYDNSFLKEFVLNPYILLLGIIVLCFLLVSNIRMFSLRFENFSFRDNKTRYIFVLGSLLLFIVLGIMSLPLIIIAYILLSIIIMMVCKKSRTSSINS